MMTGHSITLRLPTPLYERYRQRAEKTHRSVEAELLEAVTTAAPQEERLPQDLADAISDLGTLDDNALWHAARQTFPAEASSRLEALHFKRQDEGLTAEEQEIATQLVRQYEQSMLVRAHAAKLLKQRGHDISGLVAGR
jgi:plasmid stability protein